MDCTRVVVVMMYLTFFLDLTDSKREMVFVVFVVVVHMFGSIGMLKHIYVHRKRRRVGRIVLLLGTPVILLQ